MDENSKYTESILLGLAKGTHSRDMIAASFLLCLKTLTIPITKVVSTPPFLSYSLLCLAKHSHWIPCKT